MRAVVLLSTHNGSAFLEQQLQSIIDQDHRDLKLMVRDDGSTDTTTEILKAFANDPRIHLIIGSRLGLPHAYFELIRTAPDDAEAYFFCDQDDVWHYDKVSTALHQLAKLPRTRPALYCSRLNLCTHDLKSIGLSPDWQRSAAFGNALVENICTGCTAAFNRTTLDYLRMAKSTSGIIYHDWWLYLIASAFGEVTFDRTPHIEYRMHAANSVGLPQNLLGTYRRRIGRAGPTRRFTILLQQAQAFAHAYGNVLTTDNRKILDRMLSLSNSSKAAFPLISDPEIHRQKTSDDLIWRLGLFLYGVGMIRSSAVI